MRPTIDYIKKNKLLLLVIVPAFFCHMLVIMPSGSQFCSSDKCGIFFWGAHAHDAIWHLAIISTSFTKFPFIAPTYAQSLLSGYNYLIDLLMFLLSRIGISSLFSYFKLFPLIWFILFTSVAIAFARKLHSSALFSGILLFFLYFSGSFSYILTLYHHTSIWNSSGLLAMQAGLSLTNLQFAYSLIVLLYILFLIKMDSKNITLLGVLAAVNVALKFYAGVISVFLIALYILGTFIKEKKIGLFIRSAVILSTLFIISIFIFYNPTQSLRSGSTFSFAPFATVHSIIEEPEQLYMRDMVNARYYLQSLNKFSFKLIRIELVSLLLFLVFNLGTRIIGVFLICTKIVYKRITPFDVYAILTAFFAMFMATFFVQKGIWWNTIQFLYYGLFIANIFAAEAIYLFMKKYRIVGVVLATCLLILTIPNSVDVIRGFSSFPSAAYLPAEEYEALQFLKQQPHGVVLASIYRKENYKDFANPAPLASYDDTSYLTAFSGKLSYAADKVQLELLGIDYSERYKKVNGGDCSILDSVNYLYIRSYESNEKFKNCLNYKVNMKQIFKNKKVQIYLIKK